MSVLVFAGACLQGVGGLGFSVFSAPIAALLYPVLVPGPLLVLVCPLSMLGVLREVGSIDWRAAGTALGGRLAGSAVAAGLLALLPAPQLSLLFALLILVAVAISVMGRGVAPTLPNVAIAGVASGVMGTITSAGGPPLALAFQQMPPSRVRATIGVIFVVGSLMSIATLAVVGHFHGSHLRLAAMLLPWVLAGFAASTPLIRRIAPRRIRPLLLALATFGALAVLVQLALEH